MTALLAWIIIGGLAGWLASLVVQGTGMGLLADILFGILGAIVGGLIFQAFGAGGFNGFSVWSFLVAFVGSVIVLVIVKAIRHGGFSDWRKPVV